MKIVKYTKQEESFLASDNDLHIHGIVELDFKTFKESLNTLNTSFISKAKLAWTFKDHALELGEFFLNKDQILKKLRARKDYRAASYQRSLNHAIFVSSMIGLLSYTFIENESYDLLNEPLFSQIFNNLSRTFNYQQLVKVFNTENKQTSLFASSGFKNGKSSVDIYLLGVHEQAFASVIQGKLRTHIPTESSNQIDSLIKYLQPQNGMVFQPKDCTKCQ